LRKHDRGEHRQDPRRRQHDGRASRRAGSRSAGSGHRADVPPRGIDNFTRDVVERLAGGGYLVVVPDVLRSWGDDGPTPFDLLRNIRCPVIGFFGDKDTHPSPEDVDRIDAEPHGIAHDFHRHRDIGQGFKNPTHNSLQERAAAEDAWDKTFVFLRKVAPV
jgi:dienelactone hydrolase